MTMPERWHKLVSLLHLTRIAQVFAAISNSWLIIFLGRYGPLELPSQVNPALHELPLAALLALGAGIAVGLHTYAIALNDMLDRRYDRMFNRDRLLAAGRVGLTTAVAVAVVALLMALLASVFLGIGSVVLCILVAGGILFYNVIGKYLPAGGVVALGLIWALHMAIPNPELRFAWPVWLTMTHVMATAALAYYLQGKRPHLVGAHVWWACAGWAFWSLVILGLMGVRHGAIPHEQPMLWVGPLIAALLFVIVAWQMVRLHDRRMRYRRLLGQHFLQLAMLWLILYDATWLLCAGLYWPGILHLGLFVAAFVLMRLMHWLSEVSAPRPTYQVDTNRV